MFRLNEQSGIQAITAALSAITVQKCWMVDNEESNIFVFYHGLNFLNFLFGTKGPSNRATE